MEQVFSCKVCLRIVVLLMQTLACVHTFSIHDLGDAKIASIVLCKEGNSFTKDVPDPKESSTAYLCQAYSSYFLQNGFNLLNAFMLLLRKNYSITGNSFSRGKQHPTLLCLCVFQSLRGGGGGGG